VSETGSVKFRTEQAAATLEPFAALTDLNRYRSRLRQIGLLGVDANGIGFGNISVRDEASTRFYITGSGSGHKSELTLNDCAKVVASDAGRNWLRFEGTAVPSSESLTHAAIYAADNSVGAVIHGHSLKLWTVLLQETAATPATVEYGTPEMALAIGKLFQSSSVREKKAFAMAGHREGIISFGQNLAEAYAVLM
jgi:L-ribulose-5-phosphate 4-epimerase